MAAGRLFHTLLDPRAWFDDRARAGAWFDETTPESTTAALTDTITISESPARALAASRAITDTGATVSESPAGARAYARTPTDTAVTLSETVGRTAADGRGLSDSAIVSSDSVARLADKARTITDTGATVSDTPVGRARQNIGARRVLTTPDTIWYDLGGGIFWPSLEAAPATPDPRLRTITDTAVTFSETPARQLAAGRTITSTGATVSDTPAGAAGPGRTVADTGATISSTIGTAGAYTRTATDTGATISSSVNVSTGVRAPGARRQLLSNSAIWYDLGEGIWWPTVYGAPATNPQLPLHFGGDVTDTACTISDSIARTKGKPRPLTDTGATITSTIARGPGRNLLDQAIGSGTWDGGTWDGGTWDQGSGFFSDLIAKLVNRPRALTDTGCAFSESVARTLTSHGVGLTDTGCAFGESLTRQLALARHPTDTGAAITDAISPITPRTIVDTGATISETLVARQADGRTTADTLTVSDSTGRELHAERAIADTAATITDTVIVGPARTLADTITITETPARLLAARRPLADTACMLTDTVVRGAPGALVDTGTTITDRIHRKVKKGHVGRGRTINHPVHGTRASDRPALVATGSTPNLP